MCTRSVADVKTSKQMAARRQIHAAIGHYRSGEFECAITLCSAAEGQIPEPGRPDHLFRILQQAASDRATSGSEKDDFNFAANWLKHGWGADEVEIDEALVVFWLNRAVSKYRVAYEVGTSEMVGLSPGQLNLPSGNLDFHTPSRHLIKISTGFANHLRCPVFKDLVNGTRSILSATSSRCNKDSHVF